MLQGRIIRGVGGNYYVDTENGLIECRARGLFRNQNIKPLVGDNVLIRLTEENKNYGYVEEINERKNEMKRPAVSNVDQIIIVFAVKNPEPSFLLLDKLIIAAEVNKLNPIICFNKADLVDDEYFEKIIDIYKSTDYQIIFTSKYKPELLENFENILKDKITLFSGPSGVGKSSLMNVIDDNFELKTGDISEKLKRGKHTTRHAEMYKLSFGGFVVDTPGFSSFDINEVDATDLTRFYPDIEKISGECKFSDCVHNKEPGCMVKKAVEDKKISEVRYTNYLKLYEEIKSFKHY
ncbi:ribosome small subunit-dependent GTPase A [Sedimentibacter sp. zth1]|uniref:ribosome small subunit-dependent GTPase A n=1 Tax=Sedimentibacter sp. zth1 TaxID=2816908 RepID=UPI001A913ED8|nr:ribosome small subunit-dependent GTPase A [Sedimentibacter sp. zth1]QSX06856.1 ribosome small subunit-dependent GTPase A [Sedimentibacter sp. zth1]